MKAPIVFARTHEAIVLWILEPVNFHALPFVRPIATTHICSKMFLSLPRSGQYSKDRNTSHKEHIFYRLLSATKRGATFPYTYPCKLPFPLCLVERRIMNIRIKEKQFANAACFFSFCREQQKKHGKMTKYHRRLIETTHKGGGSSAILTSAVGLLTRGLEESRSIHDLAFFVLRVGRE
jgi:hypothetical protein